MSSTSEAESHGHNGHEESDSFSGHESFAAGVPTRVAVQLIAPHHKCDRHHAHIIDITYPSGDTDLLWSIHIHEGHDILLKAGPYTIPTLFVDKHGQPFTDDNFSNYWKGIVRQSEGRFAAHFPATYLRTSFIDAYTSGEGSMPERYWAGESTLLQNNSIDISDIPQFILLCATTCPSRCSSTHGDIHTTDGSNLRTKSQRIPCKKGC